VGDPLLAPHARLVSPACLEHSCAAVGSVGKEDLVKADRRWWNDGRMEREIQEKGRTRRMDAVSAFPEETLSSKRVGTSAYVPMGLRIAVETARVDAERRRAIVESGREVVYDDGECIVTRERPLPATEEERSRMDRFRRNGAWGRT